jgi:hypothetical protein
MINSLKLLTPKEINKIIHIEVLGRSVLYNVLLDDTVIATNITLVEANRITSSENHVPAISTSSDYPNYSLDIEKAMSIVEHLDQYFFVLQHDGNNWVANFGTIDNHVSVESINPARAICLAAIELVRTSK